MKVDLLKKILNQESLGELSLVDWVGLNFL